MKHGFLISIRRNRSAVRVDSILSPEILLIILISSLPVSILVCLEREITIEGKYRFSRSDHQL